MEEEGHSEHLRLHSLSDLLRCAGTGGEEGLRARLSVPLAMYFEVGSLEKHVTEDQVG